MSFWSLLAIAALRLVLFAIDRVGFDWNSAIAHLELPREHNGRLITVGQPIAVASEIIALTIPPLLSVLLGWLAVLTLRGHGAVRVWLSIIVVVSLPSSIIGATALNVVATPLIIAALVFAWLPASTRYFRSAMIERRRVKALHAPGDPSTA